MEEFLDKLYAYDYFGVYLIISIVVLVILFIIILFYGKKDQKKREIEATKKLEQINNEDAFKEENSEAKVEINPSVEELNDTIIVPSIEGLSISNEMPENVNETPIIDNIPTPVLPQETIQEEVKEEPSFVEPELPNVFEMDSLDNSIPTENLVEDSPIIKDEALTLEGLQDNPVEETPILENKEEQPLFVNDYISDSLEEVKPNTVEDISTTTFDFEKLANIEEPKQEVVHNKGPEIFSSVYVPPKQEEAKQVEEIPVPSKEELDIELPMLKKDMVEEQKDIEMPILNDYKIEDLSGETYTINK